MKWRFTGTQPPLEEWQSTVRMLCAVKWQLFPVWQLRSHYFLHNAPVVPSFWSERDFVEHDMVMSTISICTSLQTAIQWSFFLHVHLAYWLVIRGCFISLSLQPTVMVTAMVIMMHTCQQSNFDELLAISNPAGIISLKTTTRFWTNSNKLDPSSF